MPVWLTLFLSLILAAGFFAGLFGLVILLVEGRRVKAAPRLGLAPGEGTGTFNVWVNWDVSQFALEVYRLRFQYLTPFSVEKEGTFTVTFDSPQSTPFMQCVELPERFNKLLSNDKDRGILTVDFRTVAETCIQETYSLDKVRKIISGAVKKVPAIANKLPRVKTDAATVLTLDFEELTKNRKRIADLEAAAKAKAAKAAAAKPAAAATAAAPAPAPAATAPAPAAAKVETPPAKAAPVAAPPAPEAPSDKPVKSVRDVVAQQNTKVPPKPIEK